MLEKYKLISYTLFGVFWVYVSSNFVGYEIFGTPAIMRALAFPCDMLVIAMGLATLRNWRDITVIASFIALSAVSTLAINHESLFTYINGLRLYTGFLFWMPIIRYLLHRDDWRQRFIPSLDRQLYIFIVLQAIAITYQFFRWGANDHGGGLMSNYFSSVASMMQICISFYLVSKHWNLEDGYMANLKANIRYIWPLYAVFLNETKSSFIFLAVYFLLLYRWSFAAAIRLLLALPVVCLLAFGSFLAYLAATGQDFDELTSVEFYENYLVGEDPEQLVELALLVQDHDIETDNLWVVDLPRFTRLSLMPDILRKTNGGLTWGAGIGQFKGGTTTDKTQFAKANNWVLGGSRTVIFDIVVELGWIGFGWFVCAMALLIPWRYNPYPYSLRIKLMVLSMVLLMLIYSDVLFSFVPMTLLFYYVCQSANINLNPERKKEDVFGDRFLNSHHA